MTDGYYKPLDARLNRIKAAIVEKDQRDRAAALAKNPNLGFVANEMIQCTFPHRDPVGVQTYVRTNGLFRLIVESGRDPQTLESYGIPYGKIPRFLNIYINTQVAKTGSTRVEFGRNLHKFMRSIGLNPDNGSGKRSDYRRMIDQANRLFSARITFAELRPETDVPLRSDMLVAKSQHVWWSPMTATHDTIFESYIDLDPDYCEAIASNPVPVNLEAVTALKESCLALDLYGWSTYRTYLVNQRGEPVTIPYAALKNQFGADYKDQKEFNRRFRQELARVKSVYSELTYSLNEGSVTLYPAATSVRSRPIVSLKG